MKFLKNGSPVLHWGCDLIVGSSHYTQPLSQSLEVPCHAAERERGTKPLNIILVEKPSAKIDKGGPKVEEESRVFRSPVNAVKEGRPVAESSVRKDYGKPILCWNIEVQHKDGPFVLLEKLCKSDIIHSY